MCIDCGIRAADPDTGLSPNMLCMPCYDYAGWENTHDDYGHDTINAEVEDKGGDPATYLSQMDMTTWGMDMPECPVCHPERDKRREVRTGHTNTAAQSWNSHAGCKHPRTAKDRAACRKAGGPQRQA
jgi:hypothetical protein